MKNRKLLIAGIAVVSVLLCAAIIIGINVFGGDEDLSSSVGVTSVSNVYKYAVGDFNNTEKAQISEFLTEERGAVYKDDSTGEAGFKLHYTPKYTVRREGVRYTLVLVTMDVLNFETGNIAYVSEAGYYAINDEHTEIYRADFPYNGEIEIDFSENLKK